MARVTMENSELFHFQGRYAISSVIENPDSERLLEASDKEVIEILIHSLLDDSPCVDYDLKLCDIGRHYYYIISPSTIKIGTEIFCRIPQTKFYVAQKDEDGITLALVYDNCSAICFRLFGSKTMHFSELFYPQFKLFADVYT